MIRVAVSGAAGRMGEAVCEAVERADDMELAGRADPALDGRSRLLDGADVVVDFTTPATAPGNVRELPRRRRPRRGRHDRVRPRRAARGGASGARGDGRRANVFVAPNFAIGAVLMMQIARRGRRSTCPSARSSSSTTTRKLDAPSGTAKRTAELIRDGGRQRPRADPLGAPARPGRPPGGDLRRRGPDALDPPRLDRPALVHARRAARGAPRRRAREPLTVGLEALL